MSISLSYAVNSCFGWFIVILAIAGYFLTVKRLGEKWIFWNVLAIGWGCYALAQTLLLSGISADTPYIIAIWFSSYVLVISSMVLLFLKLTKVKS